MSDFSFGSAGPKGSSAFQRLQVANPTVRSGARSPAPDTKIFNELPMAEAAEQSGRLAPLGQAVGNTRATSETLSALSASASRDVAAAVLDASAPSIKDLNKAVELAGKIAESLRSNPQQFEDAQSKNLDPSVAQALTRSDDATVA